MILKITTADIQLEYSDEYSIIEEPAKNRLIEIIDKLYSYRVIHLDKPKPTLSAFDKNVFDALKERDYDK
jgi:hypothetical protein